MSGWQLLPDDLPKDTGSGEMVITVAPNRRVSKDAPQPGGNGGGWELLPDDQPAGPVRAQRENEPTRDEMKAAYREMAAGARERQGPLAATVDTVGRGIARAVPFMDDIAAAGNYYIGGKGASYQDALDRERAMNAVDDSQRPVASYGAQVAGAAAMPMFGADAATVKGGAAIGAAYGAAHGAGQGDDLQDRATKALSGGATGAAIGGALGGVIGALTHGRAAPPSLGPSGQEVAAAGERIGVDIPKIVASDSSGVQRIGTAIKNVPFSGAPLQEASERAIGQMGQSADNAVAKLGSGSVETAGGKAIDSISDWIGGKSKAIADRAYKQVDALVSENAAMEHPLTETAKAAARMAARDRASARVGESSALKEVSEALGRPGLTYEGIKALRTRIGSSTSDLITKGADKADYSRLYGALSADLASAAERAGGAEAAAAARKADGIYSMIKGREEQLAKVIGIKGDASPAQVVDKLVSAAGQTSKMNTQLLVTARKTMGPESWDEVASAALARIGRDAEGNFSPDRFISGWGRLSKEGKALLFGSTGQQGLVSSLNDLATVSSRFKSLNKYANPSGTAQQHTALAIAGGAWAAPVTTVTSLVGANVMSRVLASPATASSMAKWAGAYEKLATASGGATQGALAMFQIASRNLSATIGAKLGVDVPASAIVNSISNKSLGFRPVAAGDGSDQLQK